MAKTGEDDHLAELMRQALQGDKRAYTQLLRETSQMLRPFLAKRLTDRASVEDVLQETLISIHKARHTYDGSRPYAPWAFAIARYRMHDHLRSRYSDKLRYAGDLTEAEGISAANVTETEFTYESISGEIGQLPKKQALILQLMYRDGYSVKETAEKTGMSESAVKVSAHRAYKLLRKKLTPP